jgi:DNA-3-methyladenine glycosylase
MINEKDGKMSMLPKEFYLRNDVTRIARDLLGKVLCTNIHGEGVTAGMIVEVEAYAGRDDKACHANAGRRTRRTEIMYAQGGVAYVYFIYGMYHLFNVVTNVEEVADAILVRALEPLEGVELMIRRRKLKEPGKRLTAGPGVLTQALGITTDLYGESLMGEKIWIGDYGIEIPEKDIVHTVRIGVDYAGEDAKKDWRFYIKENPWVSRV